MPALPGGQRGEEGDQGRSGRKVCTFRNGMVRKRSVNAVAEPATVPKADDPRRSIRKVCTVRYGVARRVRANQKREEQIDAILEVAGDVRINCI